MTKSTKNKNDFYDDYAHHPTEISSTLNGIKNVVCERKLYLFLNFIATLEFYLKKRIWNKS